MYDLPETIYLTFTSVSAIVNPALVGVTVPLRYIEGTAGNVPSAPGWYLEAPATIGPCNWPSPDYVLVIQFVCGPEPGSVLIYGPWGGDAASPDPGYELGGSVYPLMLGPPWVTEGYWQFAYSNGPFPLLPCLSGSGTLEVHFIITETAP
jgi:hypothetical protein